MSDGNLPAYYFHQGTNYYSYEYLGCNVKIEKNEYIMFESNYLIVEHNDMKKERNYNN